MTGRETTIGINLATRPFRNRRLFLLLRSSFVAAMVLFGALFVFGAVRYGIPALRMRSALSGQKNVLANQRSPSAFFQSLAATGGERDFHELFRLSHQELDVISLQVGPPKPEQITPPKSGFQSYDEKRFRGAEAFEVEFDRQRR